MAIDPSSHPSPSPHAPLTIPVVLGSVRVGRQSERPAHLLVERLGALGCQTSLVDLRQLDLPVYGQAPEAGELPTVRELQATIAASDAVVILTPGTTTASRRR